MRYPPVHPLINVFPHVEMVDLAGDKVKCELQKLTLYHNIYLQSFSTLKIAFKFHGLSIVRLQTI